MVSVNRLLVRWSPNNSSLGPALQYLSTIPIYSIQIRTHTLRSIINIQHLNSTKYQTVLKHPIINQSNLSFNQQRETTERHWRHTDKGRHNRDLNHLKTIPSCKYQADGIQPGLLTGKVISQWYRGLFSFIALTYFTDPVRNITTEILGSLSRGKPAATRSR